MCSMEMSEGENKGKWWKLTDCMMMMIIKTSFSERPTGLTAKHIVISQLYKQFRLSNASPDCNTFCSPKTVCI